MKHRIMYLYATAIFHTCIAIHKLYDILSKEHSRMYYKIMEEYRE